MLLATIPTSLFANPQSDFNADGSVDLVIGIPYENVSDTTDAGGVSVVYGTATGLNGLGDEYWIQNYLDGSTSETYECFGRSLAVGDSDGDGYRDLAVGVLYEDGGTVNQAGAVNVIYGSPIGLNVTGDQSWSQGISGFQGTAEVGDRFGSALAAFPRLPISFIYHWCLRTLTIMGTLICVSPGQDEYSIVAIELLDPFRTGGRI